MKLTEAHRQYQDAIEHDRRVRIEYDEVLSADDIREESHSAVVDAEKELFKAWANRLMS